MRDDWDSAGNESRNVFNHQIFILIFNSNFRSSVISSIIANICWRKYILSLFFHFKFADRKENSFSGFSVHLFLIFHADHFASISRDFHETDLQLEEKSHKFKVHTLYFCFHFHFQTDLQNVPLPVILCGFQPFEWVQVS